MTKSKTKMIALAVVMLSGSTDIVLAQQPPYTLPLSFHIGRTGFTNTAASLPPAGTAIASIIPEPAGDEAWAPIRSVRKVRIAMKPMAVVRRVAV
jgi:hypothetical protein